MNHNTYTTGEMIDLISRDNELIFEAVSGMYDGGMVTFHNDMQWLMWKDSNTYLPITFNNEFMKTKWKLLDRVYAFKNGVRLIMFDKNYCIIQ